jgi:hypothetical protein
VPEQQRQGRADGHEGEWQPLPPHRPRAWWERLWGPDRRLGKIHGDVAAELVQHRLTRDRAAIPQTRAYRFLLDQALAAAHGQEGRVRFCLRTEDPAWPGERSRILFLSEAHPR